MRASFIIVSGDFFGAEIEPGTFHRDGACAGKTSAAVPASANDRDATDAAWSPAVKGAVPNAESGVPAVVS